MLIDRDQVEVVRFVITLLDRIVRNCLGAATTSEFSSTWPFFSHDAQICKAGEAFLFCLLRYAFEIVWLFSGWFLTGLGWNRDRQKHAEQREHSAPLTRCRPRVTSFRKREPAPPFPTRRAKMNLEPRIRRSLYLLLKIGYQFVTRQLLAFGKKPVAVGSEITDK